MRMRYFLLDLHNRAREEFCPSCPPLILEETLTASAQWFAQDMATYDYYHEDHTDRFGRGVADRFKAFNIDYTVGGENIAWVASDYLTDREMLEAVFSGWMNSEGHRENILNPHYTHVGFGLAFKEVEINGKRLSKWWLVADFAAPQNPAPIPSLPEKPCSSECWKQIRWYQKNKTLKEWDYSSGEPKTIERTIPLPELVFKIPYINMCGIEKLQLWGEVSGTLAWMEFNGKGQLSDRLEFIWEPYESFPLVINFTETKPFPGELIFLLVYMKGCEEQKCNPWIAGYTWFETFCFTSGEILSCCLLDNSGQIIEERQELPAEWIGEENLRYKVRFKGNEYLLKCSDYASYKPYQRCIIFKNGITKFKDKTLWGCRAGINKPIPNGEILTDSVISYSLDPTKDIIVPIWFWSEGA
jgi:hypothetical protein